MRQLPWRQLRKVFAVGSLAAFFVGGSILVAAADSPNPAGGGANLTATVSGKTVTITGGSWTWSASHYCNRAAGTGDRFAGGFAIDWKDPNDPGYPLAKASSSGIAPGSTKTGDDHVYYNIDAPCGSTSAKTTSGSFTDANTGFWNGSQSVQQAMTHTYSGAMPSEICLVTFDMHGKPGAPQSKDLSVATAGDNSVSTNKNIPSGGGCFAIKIVQPDDVEITNTPSVTTTTPGSPIDWTLVAKNSNSTAMSNQLVVTWPNASALANPNIGVLSLTGTPVSADSSWSCQTSGINVTCTHAALAGGATAPPIVVHTTLASSAGTGSVTTRGAVTPNDATPADNVADATVSFKPAPVPSLSISKTAVPSSGTQVRHGQTIAYTLHYANSGAAAANGAVITDTVPAETSFVSGSCNPACTVNGSTLKWTVDVAAGGSGQVSFQATVKNSVPNGTIIYNHGTLTWDGKPPVDSNTTQHPVYVPTPGQPDLSLTKSAVPASGTQVSRGQTITYTLHYANAGAAAASDAVLTDTVPANTTFLTGTCTPACTVSNGNTLQWTVSVPAGGNGQVSFAVKVDDNVADGTVILNHGTLSWDGQPPVDSNVTQHPVVVPTGDLVVTKSVKDITSGSSVVSFGDTLEYTLNVKTTGSATQHNVTLSDEVPDNLTYTGAHSCSLLTSACDPTVSGRTLQWQLGDMGPGDAVLVHFHVNIDQPVGLAAGQSITRTFDNFGVAKSTQIPTGVESNHVTTTVTKVLGIKITQPPTVTPPTQTTTTLPFTGSTVPVGKAVTDGVLFILAGILLMLCVQAGPRRRTSESGS